MIKIIRSLFVTLAVGIVAVSATGTAGAETAKHRVVLQITQNDPEVMNMVLNNAKNVLQYYGDKNESAQVEIVAYGPGLHMLRDDTSPVKDRIRDMVAANGAKLTFDACNNTKQAMEKREGHPITIIPQATMVPAGVVRVMELEEQGYDYIRP
jgi:uncharacterized protein